MKLELNHNELNNKKEALTWHLIELRNRLLISFGIFFLIMFISYFFSQNIYSFLLKPLETVLVGENRRMIYTNLTEAFFTYLKLSSFVAFLISTPIFLWNIYAFMSPGLYKKEKRAILPYILSIPLLFYSGAIFSYYFVFPYAWKFFISFENFNQDIPIVLEAKISEYLSLVMHLIFAFGIAFQLPVIISILVKTGFITIEQLKAKRRYAIVIIFIIAAIITPPDVISQISLAIPMILLYELAILINRR